ncbi:MAG: PIN domain-containing protein [Archangium sp.]|nr:PIN domain-containing protein [Archangium sp.]
MSLAFIDTSVWARIARPQVADAVADAIAAGAVVVTDLLVLELLRSARDAKEHAELREEYSTLSIVPVSPEIVERALEVQGRLALRGYHRGPSPIDLISAAAAEAAKAVLWHCDRDFELIAEVTKQPLKRLGR